MRKLSYLIALIIFLNINADSQENDINNLIYKKGKISLSSSINGGFSNDGYYSINLNVTPGIFILNNLKIGPQLGVSKSNIAFGYKSFHIMPIAEYYILNERISPIIRAGYMWEFGKMSNELFNNSSLMAGIGIAFMNKSGSFGLNIGADYYFNKMNTHKGIMPNVSFNFYFNRKKKVKKVLY